MSNLKTLSSRKARVCVFALVPILSTYLLPLHAYAQTSTATGMPPMQSMPSMDVKSPTGQGAGSMENMDQMKNMPGMPPMQSMPSMDKKSATGQGTGSTENMDQMKNMPGMDPAPKEANKPPATQPVKKETVPDPSRSAMGKENATSQGAMPMQMGQDQKSQMAEGMNKSDASGKMDPGAMPAMQMQGGSAPSDARDPDAYADGLSRPAKGGADVEDRMQYTRILVDRLESFRSSQSHGQAFDAQGWTGGDTDKLWFKVDGEKTNGKLGATRTEALWNHAIATYWSFQSGIRHDFGDGPGRNWAVFGVQGLAPYWFDVQASAYVGPSGRTALRFETEYDLYVTQRLVLQPDVKLDIFGKNDPARNVGSGLSSVEAGLRLRYEFSRKFAPYVGVVFQRDYGTTGRYAVQSGRQTNETRLVGGVRVWF